MQQSPFPDKHTGLAAAVLNCWLWCEQGAARAAWGAFPRTATVLHHWGPWAEEVSHNPIAGKLGLILAFASSQPWESSCHSFHHWIWQDLCSSDEARTLVTKYSLPDLLHKKGSRFILCRDSNPAFYVATRAILSTEAVRLQIFGWDITRNIMWKNPTAILLTQYSSLSDLYHKHRHQLAIMLIIFMSQLQSQKKRS